MPQPGLVSGCCLVLAAHAHAAAPPGLTWRMNRTAAITRSRPIGEYLHRFPLDLHPLSFLAHLVWCPPCTRASSPKATVMCRFAAASEGRLAMTATRFGCIRWRWPLPGCLAEPHLPRLASSPSVCRRVPCHETERLPLPASRPKSGRFGAAPMPVRTSANLV